MREHRELHSRRRDLASKVATVVIRALRNGEDDPIVGGVEVDYRRLGEVMLDIGVELSVLEEGILLAATMDGGMSMARTFHSLIDGMTTLQEVDRQHQVAARAIATHQHGVPADTTIAMARAMRMQARP